MPLFYTYLQDFGKNRLEWINHLRFKGFHFSLLGQSWLVHLRHRQSSLAVKRGPFIPKLQGQFA